MASRKGGAYEREICKKLSLWWTNGEGDDVFWRTSQSGGRATSRARKRKTTRGHYGDVTATDAEGLPFIQLITTEIKRGYKDAHVGAILDRPRHLKQSPFEALLEQAIDAAVRSGTPFWSMIHKRDGRMPLIYFPVKLIKHLESLGNLVVPTVINTTMKLANGDETPFYIACMKLDVFLDCVDPEDIRILARRVWS